jgi:hypothetical protein
LASPRLLWIEGAGGEVVRGQLLFVKAMFDKDLRVQMVYDELGLVEAAVEDGVGLAEKL